MEVKWGCGCVRGESGVVVVLYYKLTRSKKLKCVFECLRGV